jgi:hypothetical protein
LRTELPVALIGQRMRFTVDLPFSGQVSVFGYDPNPKGLEPEIYWLDPQLDIDGRVLPEGNHLLPSRGDGILAGGDPSESSLIAIALREAMKLPWDPHLKGPVPPSRMREFIIAVHQLPDTDRDVTIFDFELRLRGSH